MFLGDVSKTLPKETEVRIHLNYHPEEQQPAPLAVALRTLPSGSTSVPLGSVWFPATSTLYHPLPATFILRWSLRVKNNTTYSGLHRVCEISAPVTRA